MNLLEALLAPEDRDFLTALTRDVTEACRYSQAAECLRDAGIYHAEAFIAVTGQDQNNLVSCQLAKDYFGVKRTMGL